MGTFKALLLIGGILMSQDLAAQTSPEIVIGNDAGECIPGDFDRLKDTLLDYSGYKKIDDSITTTIWDLVDGFPPLPIPIRTINMNYSTPRQLPTQSPTEISRAHVLFIFQPVSLDSKKYLSVFPKVPTECVTELHEGDRRTLVQTCRLYDPNNKRYGLQDFSTKIHLRERGCQNGQLFLNYRVALKTISAHVERMKDAAQDQHLLFKMVGRGLIDELFDERKFYDRYFTDLYEAIVNSARQ